jgi:hypothetical protein
MADKPIHDVLHELAATADYLRENGRLMRETSERIAEIADRLEKSNVFSQRVLEHIDKAINAALRIEDGPTPDA